ncbi:MAG: ABC transporter ATP-binding protein [Cytophagales bacterium]|nr:ABC transporter ATP-binding protein [Cytophagales bacterium]
MENKEILKINNLTLFYKSVNVNLQILFDVSLTLYKNEILAIVGESGSGKTQTVLSILQLYEPNAIVSGEIIYNDVNLLKLSEKEINKYRGKEIAMAFQDSMTALNPYLTIKEQLIEPLLVHEHLSRSAAEKKAIEILDFIKIKDPHKKINCYPHEFSGGMRQRVMIAMSLICSPKILIADELTTALDATTQNIVLDLIKQLQVDTGMSVIFITHDLRMISKIADRIIVMYCGHIMEELPAASIFTSAQHPYTRGLLNSMPELDSKKSLHPIPGEVPSLEDMPQGCPFAPRCERACKDCSVRKPQIEATRKGRIACFNYYD